MGVAVTVGDERIQFTIRQGGFIYGKMGTCVFREQQPFLGMVKLFPAAETAQHFLVLLLIKYARLCDRTFQAYGRSPGMSPYVSFKKSPELLGVTGTFTHHFKVDGDTETLAGAQVCPSSAAYNQYDLVVTDGEIGDIYRFHKTFGLKMNITRQTRIHQLIKVNVNFP